MGQPQPKTGFLDNLFNNTAKKSIDQETRSEAEKVVNASLKQNPIKGIVSLANFYIYFNQPEEAVKVINDCIEKYGNNYSFSNCLAIAYTSLGDIDNQIKYNIKCLEFNKKSMQFVDKKQYINNMHLTNIDSAAKFFLYDPHLLPDDIINLNIEKKMDIFKFVEAKNLQLSELGISIDTYRNFLSIVFQIVCKHYVRGYNFSVELDAELDIAEIGVHFDEISPQEAFELTNEIDDAILSATNNDDVFAEQVRKLIVNCTLSEIREEEVFA